jgi:hypothetical protein
MRFRLKVALSPEKAAVLLCLAVRQPLPLKLHPQLVPESISV